MVSEHYGRVDNPAQVIVDDLDGDVTIERLATVDEFHLGGARATAALIDDLDLRASDRVIDIGCGIGGPARRMASTVGCRVLGVDLTPSFVESARQLTQLTGLDDLVEFVVGDATALDLDGPFDAATLVHVGMNIQDKAAFFSAVAQLVKPGGRLGVFDIMAVGGPSTVGYPMPFAASADQAFLSSPDAYVEALRAAGFDVAEPVDRTSLALESAAEAAAQGPPPVSLATLMGPEFASMFANAGAALRNNVLAPVEIIATR